MSENRWTCYIDVVTLTYVGRAQELFGLSAFVTRPYDAEKCFVRAQFIDPRISGRRNDYAFGWHSFPLSTFVDPEEGHA